MAEEEKQEQKRLKIADTSLSVRNLKSYLAKINDDSMPVSIELVAGIRSESSKTEREKSLEVAVKRLEKKCSDLYNLLLDAKPLVARSARFEKKNSRTIIYYDKRTGSNTGANGLLEDIEDQLNSYTPDMIQINLECGV